MTQEEKNKLLLQDLCARLPYRVKIMVERWDSDADCEFTTVETLIGIDDRFIHTIWDKTSDKDKHSIIEPLSILEYKPFLRPMSSMTEEEMEKYHSYCECDDKDFTGEILHFDTIESFDYLNSIYVDYRGLIPLGLAIAVTEENNPYKE